VQLENDPSVPKRFIEVSFSKQVIVSGISIQTPENMGLRSFSFEYADMSLQYPKNVQTFTRLLNDQQVQCKSLFSENKSKVIKAKISRFFTSNVAL